MNHLGRIAKARLEVGCGKSTTSITIPNTLIVPSEGLVFFGPGPWLLAAHGPPCSAGG